MNLLFKLIIILISIFCVNINASQSETKDIAKLSAAPLYNIDRNTLQKTIEAYIQYNPNLKALKVREALSGETYYQMYKENGNIYLDKEFPENITNYTKFNTKAIYENEVVGDITAYFKISKQNNTLLNLTQKEKNYLRNNPTIKVTEFFNEPPFTINQGDKKIGYTYELLQEMTKLSGLEIEYVKNFRSFGDMIEALAKGEVDVQPTFLSKFPLKKDSTIKISKTILSTPFVVIGRQNSPKYKSINDLKGKRVAVVKGYAQDKHLSKVEGVIKVHVKHNDEGFEALRSGKADFYVNNNANSQYIITKSFSNDLKILATLPYDTFPPLEFALGFNGKKPELVSILNKALKEIPVKKIQEIRDRWIIDFKETKSLLPSVKFNKTEKEWLKKHPNIVLGADQNWQPFDFKNSFENHSGFNADYLELLRQKLGIDIKVELGAWSELQNKVKNKKISGLVGPSITPERQKYMAFTNPYFKLSQIILVRYESASLNSLEELNGKTLAVKSGSSDYEYFKTNYPKVDLKVYDNYAQIIRALSIGEVDCAIANIGAASYEIQRNFVSNIKVAYTIDELSGLLHLGIRKDWPELVSVLNKGLQAITQEEKSILLNKWLQINKSGDNKVTYNKKERDWLKKHPSIRIAYMNYWPTNDEGKNVHTEYIDLLSKYGNININLVRFDSWKNGFNEATKGLNAHGIINLSWSKDREKNNFDYTKPYFFTPVLVVVKKDNDSISSLEDLANSSVLTKKDSITNQIINELKYNIAAIEVENEEDMYKELSSSNSKAKALLSYVYDQELLDKYNLKIASKSFNRYGEVYLGTSKNQKELYGIINKAFDAIPKSELSLIQNKVYKKIKSINVNLTKKEKEFIKNNPVIKVHNEKNWPPFNFYEFGQPKGYSIDLMNLVAKNTGLNIEFVSGPTWNEFLEMMKKDQLDVMINIVKSEERSKYMLFTDPFLSALHGIAVHKDNNDIKGFEDILKNNKKISLERGFFYHEYIEKNHPEVPLKLVDDGSQTLTQVSYKNADATLGILPVMSYLAEKNYITNLKFFGDNDANLFKPVPLRFSVRDELPELQSILQKGLASITPNEKRELSQKWLGTSNVTKDNKVHLELTIKEKEWLKNHKKVNFTADPIYFPYEGFDEDGNYLGMVSEYVKIIEDAIGIEFKKIPTKNWSESLALAKDGTVDILSNYVGEDSLQDIHLSTKAYIKSPIGVFTKSDAKKINDLSELKNKKIAVVKGYGYLNKIFKEYPNLKYIEVDNARVGLMGVSSGVYDAMICSTSLGIYKISEHGLQNLHIAYQTKYNMELGLGIRKDWQILVDIINKVINNIPKGESQRIAQEWIGTSEYIVDELDLTSEEKAWIESAKPIRYVYDVDWAPFEWKNELNEHTGIVKDILSLIEQRSGIKLQEVETQNWSEAVRLMKNDQADMYSGMGENPERKEYLNFTKNSVFKTPYVFVSRLDDKNDYLETFKTINNQKVAVVDGYTIHGILKENVPNLPLLTVKNLKEGFDKVRNKELNIFIVNAATAKYYINREGYGDLKIATKTEFNLELKIALQKEMPSYALSIIDKAIESIDEKEISDIYFKWTEVLVQEKMNWTLIYQIAGGAITVLLIIGYWNRRLKNAVDLKTKELKTLLESFDENVIASRADLRGVIIYTSDALCEVSGYSKEELLGQPHAILRHADTPKEVFKDLWTTIQSGKVWRGEIKNRKKDGGFYWVESVITPEFDDKGNIKSYSSIRQDITAKKEVEELSKTLEQKVETRTKQLNDERTYINSIMNSQSNLVISTDGKKLRSSNKAFNNFFNVDSVEEFMAKYGDCICDTFDTNEPDKFIQKVHEDKMWIDYVYENKDKINKTKITLNGKSYIFSINADKFMFDNEELKVAVFNDITELENIRENVEMILSNIMLPVLITSKKSRKILYANEYAAKQYEMNIDDLVGNCIDLVYTSDSQKDEIRDDIKNKGYVENKEEIYKTSSGKKFTGLLSVKPINYNGEESFIGMVVDITNQKEIEEEIRQIHEHTQSSIEYASLIQHSLIPSNDLFKKYFDDYFTIWHPKDIVGGDIYLFEELRNDNECLLMVIDCTGHGVPGAFVTMLVKAIERQVAAIIASDPELEVSPAWILKYFNQTMKKLLKQEDDDSISNAGFDGAILYYNKEESIIKFSGAELPLFYIEDNEIKTIKGSRHSIGYKKSDSNFEFKEHIIEAKEGMQFYLTSDGYLDQNGGEKSFPFGKRRFLNILDKYKDYSFADQQEVFLNEMQEYQGEEERNDDVTIVGIKVSKQEKEHEKKSNENWII